MAELKTAVRPEFLNRIDDIIVFNRLNEDEIAQIADGMLRKVAARMQDMEITMDWTEAAKKHLAKAGFDPIYGARPLRRAVTNEVEDLVAEESLEGKIKKGDSVTLDAADDKLVLTHKDATAFTETENKDEQVLVWIEKDHSQMTVVFFVEILPILLKIIIKILNDFLYYRDRIFYSPSSLNCITSSRMYNFITLYPSCMQLISHFVWNIFTISARAYFVL